jgi:parallel beta-helix repeat protein
MAKRPVFPKRPSKPVGNDKDVMNLSFLRCRHAWASLLSLAMLAALLPAARGAAQAATVAVPVRYDAASKTIFVGAAYSDSALAAYPSAPGAPKSPITIPQIAAALANAALLENQGGGAWLLKVNMVINPTAQLTATSASIAWLRLASMAGGTPGYIHLVADGGYVQIQGIKVTSWDSNAAAPDQNYTDGRSYLLALHGGRMDVVGAEVGYLGWADGEPSGMSWRLRATANRPETGATGVIQNSNIHDNYFGQYSFAAYGLIVTGNQFHHNAFYGFDPHDASTGFQVTYNKVYANGKHGIIFSRNCTNNIISHNEVYDNAQHGIMLDRGSANNTISDNLVYGNQDGVAIFESSNNVVRNNILRDNNRGVRVNATYDVTDEFDGISTGNLLVGNTIQNSAQYGVYLYERADRNTLDGNSITGSGDTGVYVKTGGNTILGNEIRAGGTGIAIVGGPLTPFPSGGPKPVPALELPGKNNSIIGNTIADNDLIGVQLTAAVNTVVGASGASAAGGNVIQANGTYGLTLNSATTDTTVSSNTIQANGEDGVLVKDTASVHNRISRNSITANAGLGIKIGTGANGSVAPPTISSAATAHVVAGKAPPNARIEVYRDPNGQGRYFLGFTTASGVGDWSFALPAGDDVRRGVLTAIAILANGNTSTFGGNTIGGASATYEVGAGRNGELTVFISGPSANLTLPDIKRALDVISPTVSLLENQGNGVWQANASLLFNRGVTLTLTRGTVTWLKLRSQQTSISVAAAGTKPHSYNYDSFVSLRTYNGALKIDGVKISSWDPALNTYDRDISNGRAYIIAKYDAQMDIQNADLSYLGFADGGSYGVAWRDVNDTLAPDMLRTRVTGAVLNSTFSYNYYGIYTFQAQNMVFRGSQFDHNIGYGFDPHDFSHHFTAEDNQAFANGNHGFIISRGCNNFIFRRNMSYDNHYTLTAEERHAHGFMIDPGSPNSQFAQVPSYDNLYEDNQGWGNDGYGMRILAANNTIVRHNIFTNNLQGVTLEKGSTGNTIQDNIIAGSSLYGIYLIGGADGNTLAGNRITGSGKHGIYVKTSRNTISQNVASDNGSFSAGVAIGSGIATLRESTVAAAAADLSLPGATMGLAEVDPDLVGAPSDTSAVVGNVIVSNTLVHNAAHGVELKNATGSRVEGNTARINHGNGFYLANGSSGNVLRHNIAEANVGYGIRANGADVTHNTWSENSVFGNGVGGVATTGLAGGGMLPPRFTVSGLTISGTTVAGATVEIFSDGGQQGRYFEGRATAGANGTFSFTAQASWHAPHINAIATDPSGSSSGFTYNVGQFVAFSEVRLPLVAR